MLLGNPRTGPNLKVGCDYWKDHKIVLGVRVCESHVSVTYADAGPPTCGERLRKKQTDAAYITTAPVSEFTALTHLGYTSYCSGSLWWLSVSSVA